MYQSNYQSNYLGFPEMFVDPSLTMTMLRGNSGVIAKFGLL